MQDLNTLSPTIHIPQPTLTNPLTTINNSTIPQPNPYSSRTPLLQNTPRIHHQSDSDNISKKSQHQLPNHSHNSLNHAQNINDFDINTQTTFSAFGNGFSHHMANLRRTNLINILSSKDSESRTERQNRLIMEILKFQPFFAIISANYKLLYEISSKLEYKLVNESSMVYKINEITEGYFILIRGCVQLSIPQRMIHQTQDPMELQNQRILKEIQKRNRLKLNQKRNQSRNNPKASPNSRQKTNSKSSDHQSITKPVDIHSKTIDNAHLELQEGVFPQDVVKKAVTQESQMDQSAQMLKKTSILRVSKRESVNESLQLSQSMKKKREPSGLKKGLSKMEETFWSPTQFDMEEDSEIVSENEQVQEQVQVEVPQAKEGTVLEYIDKIVKVVEEGECFGEITVGQINKRATNATAKYDSHLIVIRKQHYDLISKASLSSEMKIRYDFLLNLQLFKKVYRYSVQTFLYYMTELPCQYKTPLYTEGDQIKYVYLVKNGEFNLSKTITSHHKSKTPSTHTVPLHENDHISALRRHSNKWRQGVFKKIYSGEILGDSEAFLKKTHYNQSCQCTSQSGSIYRIEKNVFIEKILSSENEVLAIKKHLNAKYKTKLRYLDNFLDKQLQNQTIARILPPSRSCDQQIKKRRQHIRAETTLGHILSTKEGDDFPFKNQFFDEFNRTFRPCATKKRIFATCAINVKKTILKEEEEGDKGARCKTAGLQRSVSLNVKTEAVSEIVKKSVVVKKPEVPTCIKDIVAVVNCKEQYFRNRNKSGAKEISFEFEKHKLPIFIAQKFKHLVSRLQMKKKK